MSCSAANFENVEMSSLIIVNLRPAAQRVWSFLFLFSTFRGYELSMRVESESMITRLVSFGGKEACGCMNSARRCASMGVAM
jgi:hypothetical protein